MSRLAGLALAFLALVPVCRSGAQPVLVLTDGPTRYDLGRSLVLLEDPDGDLDVGDVAAGAPFAPGEDLVPNLGFTSSAFWVRFVLRSDTASRSWVLESPYAPLDHVDLYAVRDGVIGQPARAGDRLPLALHAWPGRTPRFRLDLRTGVDETFYLHVVGGGNTVLPLRVWETSAFERHDFNSLLLVGMFLGLLLVMIAYNAVILFSSRDILYLYYILYVAGHVVFEVGYLGIGVSVVAPRVPDLMNHAMVSGAGFAVFFATLFTRRFLRKARSVRWLRVSLDVCVAVGVLVAAGSVVLPYVRAMQVVNAGLVAFSAMFIIAAIGALRHGDTAARIYLIAWTMFLAGVIGIGLRGFGVLEWSAVTSYGLQMGSILEVILLSLALADRITVMRREAVESERELRRATEAKLYYDHLTGLPNRNSLIRDTAALRSPTLYLVNIDGFKQINDFYGNRLGDAVILELMRRIVACGASRPVSVYRLHADEYAVVTEGNGQAPECLDYARRLVSCCAGEAVSVEGQDIRFGVSVGISRDREALLEHADMALAEAREGGEAVGLYDPSMETRKQYEHNLHWVAVIRDALKSDGVLTWFQPIRTNADGSVGKYECLARLRGADGSIVGPATFLPVAKASRLYPELSRCVIRRGFETLARVADQISLNLSIEDIEQPKTVQLIRDCLGRTAAGPRVVFEILESEGIERYDVVTRFIDAVKTEGCSIAIDDFGSGYSNFEHILRLDVDYLKLDRSLIRDLDRDEGARAVVRAIQGFAVDLGIETVAEYVHSAAIQAEVVRLGLPYSQGYHVGEPAPHLGTGGIPSS